MAYFTRIGESAFRPSRHVGGAWDPSDQHIAPAMGLLAHVVELDRDSRRGDGLILGRISYDILGTVPVQVVETEVRVLRPGRTIELVEAVLCHAGKQIMVARAWLMQRYQTADLAGTPLPGITPPGRMTPWDPTTVWPGDFLGSLEVRREQADPGRAAFWVRPRQALVEAEPVSPTARAAGLLDLANGMTVRVSPQEVAFPNIDLTVHFLEEPDDGWLGFDTSVSFGSGGVGVTSSTIYRTSGPVGTMSQILTLRPRGGR